MRDDYYIDENGYYRYRNSDRLVHRYIAQKHVVERKLRRYEIVHHINGNKLDNRPKNLAVMTQEEHQAIHNGDWDGRYYEYDSGCIDGNTIWTIIKVILFIVTLPFSLIVLIIWWFCIRD